MINKKIYFFIGTTAELIKLAPVIKECENRSLDFKIISSGQNEINFTEFKSVLRAQKPDHIVNVTEPFKNRGVLIRFTAWSVLSLLNSILYFRKEFKNQDKKEILMIVHGDTVSSLIGAICAKLLGIRLMHIESGLRSFNFFEPFPEEICRLIVSHLADVHFCPNDWAVNNLKTHKGTKINTQNNTLIESLTLILDSYKGINYKKIPLDKKFFLLILHRQEHIFFKKDLTEKLIKIFSEVANPQLKCVLVLHKLTEDFLESKKLLTQLKENKNFILIPRLPYGEFMKIMQKAEFVATDGGSNQEEAYYLGKPCLVLRNVTERIEGLDKNVVLSHGDEKIIRDFIFNYTNYKKPEVKFATAPSKIIVDYIIK